MGGRLEELDETALDAADRIARAAYLWIRHMRLSGSLRLLPGSDDDALLAAGLLSELCRLMDQSARQRLLAAWAYGWLDHAASENGAMTVVRAFEQVAVPQTDLSAYLTGQGYARDLLNLINDPFYSELNLGDSISAQ